MPFKNSIGILNQIGILPTDDTLNINRKRFVVYEAIAMSIGGIEVVSKMALYYLHERAWIKILKR